MDSIDVESGIGQPFSQNPMTDTVGHAGIDERDSLLVLERITVDVAQPWGVERQHYPKNPGCHLNRIIERLDRFRLHSPNSTALRSDGLTASSSFSPTTKFENRSADGRRVKYLHLAPNESENRLVVEEINVLADPAIEVVTVAAQHGGYSLQFPEGDLIAQEISQKGEPHEYSLLAMVGAALPADAVVIDVGANVGNHAIYLASQCGARVHAFEPNEESLLHLRANIARNGLENAIEVHEIALGSESGAAQITSRPAGNLGGVTLETGTGPIIVARLDDHPFDRVDLLKVDVEGGELEVLRGASLTLRMHRPLVVAEAQDLESLWELDGVLESLGYRRWDRDLSPQGTPTYLYTFGRVQHVEALARNVPRVAQNRIDKLRKRMT